MPFCQLCSNLDLSAISRIAIGQAQLGFVELGERRYPDHSYFYYTSPNSLHQIGNILTPHYDSISPLSISAKSCELCYLIQSSMSTFWKGVESWKELEFGQPTSDYELWLAGGHDDGFQILGLEKGAHIRHSHYVLMGNVGFALHNTEGRLKDIIRRQVIPLSPSSPPVLERIKSWIKECTETHEHTLPQTNFMPTRLLKIADFGRQVSLQFPATKHSSYVALSHCWGSIAPMTLTSRTLHELEAGIRTEELPQNFQDAIWLTHQLGIHFLWIDSLCIVQDDPKDWAQESAMMYNVYNNSFITIAASRAAHSSEGFLGKRVEKSYVPVPFHCQGIFGEVLAFALPLGHVEKPERSVLMENEPLSCRGWALQERYVSRRILHFASDQIFFECEKYCVAESTFKRRKYPNPLGTALSGGFKNMHESRCLELWYDLVEMYSMRKLTQSDDKLPALSGLAAYFSRQRSVKSNQYIAGLWSDDIIRGLCWQCEPRGIRPTKYRAPTWSWTSLDGRVQCIKSRMNELVVVQNIHVDLESPSRSFGQVLGGWISMKVIKLRPHTDSVSGIANLKFSEDDVSFELGCSWDVEPFAASRQRESILSMLKETELLVIPLGWVDSQDRHPDDTKVSGPRCLILQRVESNDHFETTLPVFQRIGFGVAFGVAFGAATAELKGNRLDRDMNQCKLERLITDKWAVMKQQGNLEEIVII
ncbi:HET-domain-containing protein [Xylaria scruposa]|nr:HET-domain-containing protein [Xylaria scruposa]